MEFYRNCLFIILALAMTQPAFAQRGTLKGMLQNSGGEPIPFANVALLKASDSTLITGVVTDAKGNFSLSSPAAGNYFLQFSAVGYTTILSKKLEVSGSSFGQDFGIIAMKEATAVLDGVTVESTRPTIVVEADKMVVNVEGTAVAAGSTAFEVLTKAPGVWVDQDGNLQLNGKSGVMVMIDGRPSYLSAKELQTMLEGMPAENIKNIEIINSPSARYDAEGTAGILNINLKKNALTGINGSVYGGYYYNRYHFYNGGGNINFKDGKWSSFVNLDMAQRGHWRDQEMERIFVGEKGTAQLNQNGDELREQFSPSVRLGTDVDLNDNHSLGFIANLSYRNSDNYWNTVGFLNDYGAGSDSFIDARNDIEEDFRNGLLNFHYKWKMDTSGTSLSANLDYVRLENDSESKFLNYYEFPENGSSQQEHLSSITGSAYDIYSAKLDLEWPVSDKTKLELGAKASHVISDSELNFYQHVEEQKMLDPGKSNHFVYEENIFAGYASMHYRINDHWNLKAGLRAEQTVAEGRSITLQQTNPKNYLSLFPSVFVQQNVNDNYQVNYSYSRRISRPDYQRLNPFIFYLDPYTYVEGNPHLRPQYINAFQVTQTFKKSYNVVLAFDHSTDVIVEVPLQDPETKETAFASRNMNTFRNYSATFVVPVDLTSGWSFNNNVIVAHQEYSTVINNKPATNEQLFFMARSNHQIKLPMDIKLELNAAYRGPVAYGLYRMDSQWWIDTGIKRSFMNDKLDLSLSFTDIFRTMQMTGGSDINGNTMTVDQYFGSQSFRINLRYNFNKGDKFESRNSEVDLEELNRAGGN